ncbi:hypothetical protein LSAT2_018142 [Lamellibrachia satsuma]|nr:hypothetical protein LSAT2_018142 [Lamellibrachia satsuma]
MKLRWTAVVPVFENVILAPGMRSTSQDNSSTCRCSHLQAFVRKETYDTTSGQNGNEEMSDSRDIDCSNEHTRGRGSGLTGFGARDKGETNSQRVLSHVPSLSCLGVNRVLAFIRQSPYTQPPDESAP